MKIGVPREIKIAEGRVGLIPEACRELVHAGHEVAVEQGAGQLSGYTDDDYRVAGVCILPDAAALYGDAELVVKVKEPVAGDLQHLRGDHLLFCFLHLAADSELTRQLCEIGLTAVAFETVTDASGGLPLLAPMSDIAGRLSVQIGANLLHQHQGGRGVLMGGMAMTERGHVVVLGAGHAGGAAARMAADMGARVTVFDKNAERLRAMHRSAANIEARYAHQLAIDSAIREADLLVGAVLLPGAHAPRLVSREQVQGMLPGSVIVDIAVDQGGCIETIHPTHYLEPTYIEHGVVHFGVTNMPGAVPRTASQALSAVITPYVQKLTAADWRDDPGLADGVNVAQGDVVLAAIRQ